MPKVWLKNRISSLGHSTRLIAGSGYLQQNTWNFEVLSSPLNYVPNPDNCVIEAMTTKASVLRLCFKMEYFQS